MCLYGYREKADRESRAQLQASGRQMNIYTKDVLVTTFCITEEVMGLGNNSLS